MVFHYVKWNDVLVHSRALFEEPVWFREMAREEGKAGRSGLSLH